MKWYRFIQTTIDKLCEAETVEALDKVYDDAKYGWTTAAGEARGNFERMGLTSVDIALIDDVYYKLRNLLK